MKLEDLFKKRSKIHLSLVLDKRANERSIARLKKACKSEDYGYFQGYFTAKIDVYKMQNKEIKRRVKKEMGVI